MIEPTQIPTTPSHKPNVLVIGTGEYTTGYVHNSASKSDKPVGVVCLTLFHLRDTQDIIDNITLAGTNGSKFPGIKSHFKERIPTRYNDIQNVDFDHYPSDDTTTDKEAYITALESLNKGDIVIIFTPDHLHYQMAYESIKRGMHVLVTKPLVQRLEHHVELAKLAKEMNVLVGLEVHKRWDPIYADARENILEGKCGDFSFFQSYMSQPTSQLLTFKHWASHSDISYYLNAHHIDFHCWSIASKAHHYGNDKERAYYWRPIKVVGVGSKGVATSEPYNLETEDSITLTVEWKPVYFNEKESKVEVLQSKSGTAIYTSSWVGPEKAEVHSQQRFFYQGTKGEINIDQAHRGYGMSITQNGYKSVNPLYMKYTPDTNKNFAGQLGYGYRSLASFVKAACAIENKKSTVQDYHQTLPVITDVSTLLNTAILEAGRSSLDNNSKPVQIVYDVKTRYPINLE